MRLNQIRDFVTVVESGSIRAAARKLGVSQPAITKSVRGLEAELHSRLMQRTPHGIVPTASGRAFFARARVAQAELRKGEEEVTHLSGGESAGSVAFGIGPVATISIVPEAITRFRQRHPRAHIRIVEGYASTFLPLIRDGTLDFALAIRPDAKADPALTFRPLFRIDYAVVARKGHPLRDARSLTELRNASWLNVAPLGSSSGALDQAFSSAGLTSSQQTIRCDSYHVALTLLAKTDMLSILARRMLTDSPARELLQQIPVAEQMPSRTVGIFTRTDSPLTSIAAEMAKAVTLIARQIAKVS